MSVKRGRTLLTLSPSLPLFGHFWCFWSFLDAFGFFSHFRPLLATLPIFGFFFRTKNRKKEIKRGQKWPKNCLKFAESGCFDWALLLLMAAFGSLELSPVVLQPLLDILNIAKWQEKTSKNS